MPYTPYHFGPSGLVGLLLRRWIDVPVFVLANVAIDLSVLGDDVFAASDNISHQFLHFHTLLVGGLAGLVLGAVMYFTGPLRALCEKGMFWLGLTYKASLKKMLLAGLLGAWFHVAIDSIHHADVQIFWPLLDDNAINNWLNGHYNQYSSVLRCWVVRCCLLSWSLLFIRYGMLTNAFRLKARFAAVRRFRRLIALHQLTAG